MKNDPNYCHGPQSDEHPKADGYLRIVETNRIWVCLACGKTSKDKYGDVDAMRGWDVSCYMNSVCVDEDKVVRGENDRVIEIKEK